MPRHDRAAFTLIELLIAIALGLVIVYTAFAGFRAASQSVTVANRLSLENSLLRAGYLAAHEELDFWQMYDDPEDMSRQKLRARVSVGLENPNRTEIQGMPFTPFRDVPAMAQSSGGDRELQRGWISDERAFSAHDQRTWYRGNMAEKTDTKLIYGRYGVLGNMLRSAVNHYSFSDTTTMTDPVTNLPVTVTTTSNYNGVEAPRNWYYNQVESLRLSLGNFGLCEYLPANAIYATYGTLDDRLTNLGGAPLFFIRPSNGVFCNGDGGQKTARSKYRQTYQTSYMLSNPNRTGAGSDGLNGDMRRYWHVGYSNHDMGSFTVSTVVPIGLLDGPDADIATGDSEKPLTWPDVTVTVSRFIKNVRHVNAAKVRWTSPLTGELVELSFAGFGTTLQGARQQRRPDGGWAEWDNGPGTYTGPQYKTLDSY